MTGVFTSLVGVTIFFGCTAIAVRVNVIGDAWKIERSTACSGDQKHEMSLLMVQVKELLDKVDADDARDVYVAPGETIFVSGDSADWDTILEDSSNRDAKSVQSLVYLELEPPHDAASHCWRLAEDNKPLVLPQALSDRSSQRTLSRNRRQIDSEPFAVTTDADAHCCTYGLDHFLAASKDGKSRCQKIDYPPHYGTPKCYSAVSLCCQCCQAGYEIKTKFGTRICGLAERFGYKGSCLAALQKCCLDREAFRKHVSISFNENGNCTANGTVTTYRPPAPKSVEWEVMSKPGYGKVDRVLMFISIIENWAEATEINVEPNGDRMSSGLFNATLDVTFPDGQKLHIDYTRVPGEGETEGYSIVVNVAGSIPESFTGLLKFTTLYLSADFTDEKLTTVRGVADRETIPAGMSISLNAVFKPRLQAPAPSKVAQLDINNAQVESDASKVKIQTTSYSSIWSIPEKECQNGFLNLYQECECCTGWNGTFCEVPVCRTCKEGPCTNDGDICRNCYAGFKGDHCNETLCRRRDIVFVLDMSVSLNGTDFRITKEFVIDFMRASRSSIGPCKTRYAIIKYGYAVETEFDFTYSQQPTSLAAATRNMQRVKKNKGTRTVNALKAALRMLQTQGRAGVDWTIILVSDGKSTDDKRGALEKIINKLNSNEVRRVSIGVGSEVNENSNELNLISSSKQRTLLVQSFSELTSKSESASEFICRRA